MAARAAHLAQQFGVGSGVGSRHGQGLSTYCTLAPKKFQLSSTSGSDLHSATPGSDHFCREAEAKPLHPGHFIAQECRKAADIAEKLGLEGKIGPFFGNSFFQASEMHQTGAKSGLTPVGKRCRMEV
ncbi:hypothetical protein LP419_15035 [Massilia sp. H-1]|nr:hypothetical protein LP419_15035 [Massilia sp. H-1]